MLSGIATATVIAPGVAVTAAHAANLVPEQAVMGRSAVYDLLFFRTDRRAVPPIGTARLGTTVIAYGHGVHDAVREVRGPVRAVDAPMERDCAGCAPEYVLMYEAPGGEGFSGGPVYDRDTAQLLGITFGYKDGVDPAHPDWRLMYAYSMTRVFAELQKVQAREAAGSP